MTFDKTVHDFGTIPEMGGNVQTTFKFTNTGGSPLLIVDARGSCGCTVPTYPKNINETVFAEFPSSTDAVRCAISIHYNFKKENSQNPDTYQIHGKIGIHMGEVYEKKGDLFGDGVNLAARIQPIAETDGTVCTQSVYNAIRSDNTIFLRDMGRIALKNIQDTERVFRNSVTIN